MSTDLCPEGAVVHITTPQIITSESVVSVGGAGAGRAGGSAVELGRRLLLAARAGDTPLVLDLMAKGAPFTTDWLGTSPLHLAASNDHVETCGVLLRAGVSRDSRTKVERTPLHLAAYAGHAAVAALLLEHGALVDCKDMLRMTPLHWAAERGHADVAAALLRHGADPRVPNKFHKTPLTLASERQHAAVLALLHDALRQQEAARSVRALLPERPAEEPVPAPEPPRQAFPTVHKIQEIKIKPKPVQEKTVKPELKTESVGSSGGEGAAAQLLRRHGITLLPADDGSTLLNALQSGRTVVLSDAGKLMLKESGSETTSTGGRGVVLTATPVRAPPPGVKVFTLNNRARAAKDAPTAPRRITIQDNQPIKFVQLPENARIVSPRRGLRARRVTPLPAAAIAPATAIAPAAPTVTRPPVKIIMNKSNFERLVAGARLETPELATQVTPVSAPEMVITTDITSGTVTSVSGEAEAAGDEAVDEGDSASLAVQLAAARRAVARLERELRDCRARLTRYEPE